MCGRKLAGQTDRHLKAEDDAMKTAREVTAESAAGRRPRQVSWQTLPEQIEQLKALDAIANPLKQLAQWAMPEGSRRKDFASGTWLGHPLHPPLTDVVVGSWTSAFLFDLAGGDTAAPAAQALVAIGVLAALPTAATGLSDWAELRGGSRRLGVVHALANVSALTLNGLSLFARRRGRRDLGRGLSASGYLIVSGAAWLGGHLSFGEGIGVNQTAFDAAPKEWIAVLDESELGDDALVGAQADGTNVLLVRHGGTIYALDDRCSHRGCALHEGTLDGEAIRCPCHGSTFRLDGSIIKGPAAYPQPRFDVRLHDGHVEIRSTLHSS